MEPIRVKLDKQGATFLKEEKTVDAIVRPHLLGLPVNNSEFQTQICLVLLLYNKKSLWKILGMGEWAPPIPFLSSPTPPGGFVALKGDARRGERRGPITLATLKMPSE